MKQTTKEYVEGYEQCLSELEQTVHIAQLQTNIDSVEGILHVYNEVMTFLHSRRLYVEDMQNHVDSTNTQVFGIIIK